MRISASFYKPSRLLSLHDCREKLENMTERHPCGLNLSKPIEGIYTLFIDYFRVFKPVSRIVGAWHMICTCLGFAVLWPGIGNNLNKSVGELPMSGLGD